MNSRYKIVFGCVLFNLLLEYWAHGIEYFVGTWYATPTLFLLYLTYFSMLEDLIIRYHLRDYQVLNVGFVFGLFHETLNTGSVFGNQAFLGLDLTLLLLINIGWWGFLQSVLAMYFANRLSARDWSHSSMGKIGWISSISYNAFVVFAALLDANHPERGVAGYLSALTINCLAILLFWKTLRPRDTLPFNKSRLVDAIVVAQATLCVIIGTFLGSGEYAISGFPRHEFTVILLILWTLCSGLVLLIFRAITRKSISV